MDLLDKIRQKGRQEQEKQHTDASLPLKEVLPESSLLHKVESTQQLSDYEDLSQNDQKVAIHRAFPEISRTLPETHRRVAPRDPLEVILAGREAAGCSENLLITSEEHSDIEQGRYQEFLCFKVADEVYGIDIIDIKELIKPREVTEVPRTPSFVSGVISLRGVIIPIIDMLDRLGLVRETITGRERVIIVRQGESFSGLLVDEIIQVVRVAKDDIEAAPTVLEGIDRDLVTGIGRADDQMIILMNISNISDIHLH